MKSGMFLVVSALSLLSSLSAMAQSSLSSELIALGETVAEVEVSLSPTDRGAMRDLLRRMRNIAEQYSEGGPTNRPQNDPQSRQVAVCVSNGEAGT